MQLLHETTGQPKDRCLAALLNVQANVSSHEARLETAAAELMDQVDAQVVWRVGGCWLFGVGCCCAAVSFFLQTLR